MDRIAVGGLSLHQSDFEGLERAKRNGGGARALADVLGASELVLLSTCNRLEIVYARESGHRPCREDLQDLRRGLGLEFDALGDRLFHHVGKAAARHLLRVAASLDSLVVGEDQILSQVRQAFQDSKRLGLTGPMLGPLFENAVQLGKQVRTETDLSRHPVSIVSLAVRLMRPCIKTGATIGILGAGRTCEHAVKSLIQNGYSIAWVANRTIARAEALASKCNARVVALEHVRAGEVPADVILSASSAKGTLLDSQTLGELALRTPSGAPFVAVDLALPRDLEVPADFERLQAEGSGDGKAAGFVIDLEALRALAAENQRLRRDAALRAEALIERKLERLEGRDLSGRSSKVVAALFEEARESFEIELGRLFRGRLAHLSDEDRRSVERWARTTFGRLAHLPTKALQDLARRAGADSDPPDESALSA